MTTSFSVLYICILYFTSLLGKSISNLWLPPSLRTATQQHPHFTSRVFKQNNGTGMEFWHLVENFAPTFSTFPDKPLNGGKRARRLENYQVFFSFLFYFVQR